MLERSRIKAVEMNDTCTKVYFAVLLYIFHWVLFLFWGDKFWDEIDSIRLARSVIWVCSTIKYLKYLNLAFSSWLWSVYEAIQKSYSISCLFSCDIHLLLIDNDEIIYYKLSSKDILIPLMREKSIKFPWHSARDFLLISGHVSKQITLVWIL